MPTFVRPGLARLLPAALVVLACPVSAAGARVSIAGFAFGPRAINIKVGDSVAWSNTYMTGSVIVTP